MAFKPSGAMWECDPSCWCDSAPRIRTSSWEDITPSLGAATPESIHGSSAKPIWSTNRRVPQVRRQAAPMPNVGLLATHRTDTPAPVTRDLLSTGRAFFTRQCIERVDLSGSRAPRSSSDPLCLRIVLDNR